MALLIDRAGGQREKDLLSVLRSLGGTPVRSDRIEISEFLGSGYKVKRLADGRILYYEDISTSEEPGGQVLLTPAESRLIETEEEYVRMMLAREKNDAKIIEQMLLRDIVPGPCRY